MIHALTNRWHGTIVASRVSPELMPTEMIVRIDTQKSIDVLKNAFAIPYPPKSAADVAQIVFFAATVKFAFVPLVAYTTIFAAAAAVRFDNRSDDHPTS